MASRRVRIKGLASIPQRTKPKNSGVVNEDVPNITKSPKEINEKSDETNLTSKESHATIAETAVGINTPTSENIITHRAIEENNNPLLKLESSDKSNVSTVIEQTAHTTCVANQRSDESLCSTNGDSDGSKDQVTKPQLPIRRKFIKPQIAVNTISRRKTELEEKVSEPSKDEQEPVCININELKENIFEVQTQLEAIVQNAQSTSNITQKLLESDRTSKSNSQVECEKTTKELTKPQPVRRKFIKPQIAVNVISRNRNQFEEKKVEAIEDRQEPTTFNLNDTSITETLSETFLFSEESWPVLKENVSEQQIQQQDTSIETQTALTSNCTDVLSGNDEKSQLLARRKFIKSQIAVSVFSRKKNLVEERKAQPGKKDSAELVTVNVTEISACESLSEIKENVSVQETQSQAISKEQSLSSCNILEKTSGNDKGLLDITPQLPARRKFIKPQIAVHTISRKKNQLEEKTIELDKEGVQEPVTLNLNETLITLATFPLSESNLPAIDKDLFEQQTQLEAVLSETQTTSSSNITEKLSETGERDLQLQARRKFIKPQIAVNTISRKKNQPEEKKTEPNKENVLESVNINLNETLISPNKCSIAHKNDLSPGPSSAKICHSYITQRDSLRSGSDTEYPLPPASPSKILNRRIKAVPRFNQRRTSFSIGSASESEDDSRRTYSRVRNDSVCSVASTNVDVQPTKEALSPTRKEASGVSPRKVRRGDQGRKVAEARRNFYQKFSDGKLDKQKLTMMDLIYYNPTTNPMNPRKRKLSTVSATEAFAPKQVHLEEEKIDEPDSDDSDGDILAPQIRVDQNGEIIIDEQSLVVENKEVAKNRAILEASEAIDGDLETSYGVYKRVKRSKDWNKEETLRFYKALNTIGTDFSMMCELFPGRTRRELKLKFKKEERSNRTLIDRAVMEPVEFDMTELRRDLEKHARLLEERKRRAEETKLVKEQEKQKRLERNVAEKNGKMERRKAVKVTADMGSGNVRDKKEKIQQERKKRKRKNAYEAVKKGINSLLEETEDEESDEEYIPSYIEKGKLVKSRTTPRLVARKKQKKIEIEQRTDEKLETPKKLMPRKNVVEETLLTEETLVSEAATIPEKILEPGALMFLQSKAPDGQTVLNLFMVTDEQGKQQTSLQSKTLENNGADKNGRILNVQSIATISENLAEIIETEDNIPITRTNIDNQIKITQDSIIFPFEECTMPTVCTQNITISHDDNKMTIVTEADK